MVTAPFQAPDEPAHLQRIWQLSEGHVTSVDYGGVEPRSIGECFDTFLPIAYHAERKTSLHEILREFHRPLDPGRRQFIQFANTAIYSPVPYIPQTIACFIGRVLSLPPIALMYMGRVANVVGYAMVGWFAIRTLPILKWSACLVLLAPLPVFLAGSLSADPMTTALAFLATAAALRMISSDPPAPRRWVALLLISLIGTALCKWTYFTIVILLLAVPCAAWGKKWGAAIPLGIAGCALVALAVWSLAASSMHVPLRNGDPLPQLHWVESHPLQYVQAYVSTIHTQGLALLWTSIGALGWIDFFLPATFVFAYMAITLWTVINEGGGLRVSNKLRLLAMLAALLSTGLIVTCDYLVWNRLGNSTVEGLQGRYFLPLALVVFVSIRGAGRWGLHPWILRGFMVLSCCYTVVLVVMRYY